MECGENTPIFRKGSFAREAGALSPFRSCCRRCVGWPLAEGEQQSVERSWRPADLLLGSSPRKRGPCSCAILRAARYVGERSRGDLVGHFHPASSRGRARYRELTPAAEKRGQIVGRRGQSVRHGCFAVLNARKRHTRVRNISCVCVTKTNRTRETLTPLRSSTGSEDIVMPLRVLGAAISANGF
jgi:hypothetical protein